VELGALHKAELMTLHLPHRPSRSHRPRRTSWPPRTECEYAYNIAAPCTHSLKSALSDLLQQECIFVVLNFLSDPLQGKPGAPGALGPVGPKGERGERVSTSSLDCCSSSFCQGDNLARGVFVITNGRLSSKANFTCCLKRVQKVISL